MRITGATVDCPGCEMRWPVPRRLRRTWRCANCRTLLYRRPW